MYEWKDINWRKLERNIFKLQKRIYQASSRGDVKLVRKLQKLLITPGSPIFARVRRILLRSKRLTTKLSINSRGKPK
nr:reverse transcriptase N-terminal domain-containing protein [Anabaena sp. 54]